MGRESAKVVITDECKIKVWTGSSPHGQGLETTYAQLAAAEFSVPLERVTVFYGDSNALPWGIGTFGSRSLSIGGSAVVDACRKVKTDLVIKASEILGIPKEELTIEERSVGQKTIQGIRIYGFQGSDNVAILFDGENWVGGSI